MGLLDFLQQPTPLDSLIKRCKQEVKQQHAACDARLQAVEGVRNVYRHNGPSNARSFALERRSYWGEINRSGKEVGNDQGIPSGHMINIYEACLYALEED